MKVAVVSGAWPALQLGMIEKRDFHAFENRLFALPEPVQSPRDDEVAMVSGAWPALVPLPCSRGMGSGASGGTGAVNFGIA